MTLPFKEQLLNIYLLNLDQIYIDYENRKNYNADDPEFYNSLYQLCKYYYEIDFVPMEHRKYLLPIFKNFLNDLYSDFCIDNDFEKERSESFEEFLSTWVDTNHLYAQSKSQIFFFILDDWISNTLKKIYKIMICGKKV